MTQNTETANKKLLFISGFAWLFDAMDVGLLSYIIAALTIEWHLSEVQIGWIGSMSSIGMAIGAFIFGILADRIGRKAVLIITLLVFSITTGISALSTTYAIFLGLRFFVGAGLGGELPVASTLVSENTPVAKRGRYVVLLESFWAGGWIVSSLLAYFIIPSFGWRIALLVSALTALYALYLRRSLPESAKYQAQITAKTSVITKIKTLWTHQYARSTVMLWVVWFMIVFSYYGMFLWLPSVMMMKGFNLVHSFGYTLIMTLAQLPGYFIAAWLVEKWGRKSVLMIFLIGTAFSALGFGSATHITGILIFGILLSFFNLGAWGVLYAYSPEQYPLVIRGTGTGLAAGVGRIGGIVGPLLVGILVSHSVSLTAIFSIFFISIIIAVIVIAIFGQETRGKQLD